MDNALIQYQRIENQDKFFYWMLEQQKRWPFADCRDLLLLRSRRFLLIWMSSLMILILLFIVIMVYVACLLLVIWLMWGLTQGDYLTLRWGIDAFAKYINNTIPQYA